LLRRSDCLSEANPAPAYGYPPGRRRTSPARRTIAIVVVIIVAVLLAGMLAFCGRAGGPGAAGGHGHGRGGHGAGGSGAAGFGRTGRPPATVGGGERRAGSGPSTRAG